MSGTKNTPLRLSPIRWPEGDSVRLSATGAARFEWSTGDISHTIVVNPSASESYSVFGISAEGCMSDMKWVDVNVLPKPIAAFQLDATTALDMIRVDWVVLNN